MSAGPFNTLARYELENDMITKIRVQPETEAANVGGTANPSPAGARTPGIPSAKISLNNGEIGLRPRLMEGVWTTIPTGSEYEIGGPVRLPLLAKAASTTFVDGATVDYLGGQFEIRRILPELVN